VVAGIKGASSTHDVALAEERFERRRAPDAVVALVGRIDVGCEDTDVAVERPDEPDELARHRAEAVDANATFEERRGLGAAVFPSAVAVHRERPLGATAETHERVEQGALGDDPADRAAPVGDESGRARDARG